MADNDFKIYGGAVSQVDARNAIPGNAPEILEPTLQALDKALSSVHGEIGVREDQRNQLDQQLQKLYYQRTAIQSALDAGFKAAQVGQTVPAPPYR